MTNLSCVRSDSGFGTQIVLDLLCYDLLVDFIVRYEIPVHLDVTHLTDVLDRVEELCKDMKELGNDNNIQEARLRDLVNFCYKGCTCPYM